MSPRTRILDAAMLVFRRQGKGTFVATHGERQVRFRFLRLAPDLVGVDHAPQAGWVEGFDRFEFECQ